MNNSLNKIFKELGLDEKEITDCINQSRASYVASNIKINKILENFYLMQSGLCLHFEFMPELPQEDIFLNQDKSFFLLSSKVRNENNVIIKELIIPCNSKRKYASEPTDQESGTEVEDSDISDCMLSPQQVEKLARKLIFDLDR
jgi:hypothetical protein